MPNWCYNRLTIVGALGDRREFRVLAGGYAADYTNGSTPGAGAPAPVRLPLALNARVPVPSMIRDLGYAAAGHDWQLAHWGTKWEMLATTEVVEDSESLTYRFDTAWAPPVAWLAAVAAQFPWLKCTLAYLEPEMGIAGHVEFADGILREHKELNGSPELVSAFGLKHFDFDPYFVENEDDRSVSDIQ